MAVPAPAGAVYAQNIGLPALPMPLATLLLIAALAGFAFLAAYILLRSRRATRSRAGGPSE